MKENFSKRVQLIMKHAKEEALRLGHSYVGSEHLLLGMIRLEVGLGVKILDIYDIDLADMRTMIEDMIKSSGGTMTLGHLPLTRRAERILRNAYNEAAALGASVADDEHLLLAMFKETEGIAFEVLNSYNLDYEGVLELLNDDVSDDDDEENEVLPVIKKEKRSKKSKTPALDHFSRNITELARKGKLEEILKIDSTSLPHSFTTTTSLAHIRGEYKDLGAGAKTSVNVIVAGRIISARSFGKLVFFDIRDTTEQLQLLLDKENTPNETVEVIENL